VFSEILHCREIDLLDNPFSNNFIISSSFSDSLDFNSVFMSERFSANVLIINDLSPTPLGSFS
jgi:hypothetical protein